MRYTHIYIYIFIDIDIDVNQNLNLKFWKFSSYKVFIHHVVPTGSPAIEFRSWNVGTPAISPARTSPWTRRRTWAPRRSPRNPWVARSLAASDGEKPGDGLGKAKRLGGALKKETWRSTDVPWLSLKVWEPYELMSLFLNQYNIYINKSICMHANIIYIYININKYIELYRYIS